MSDPSFVIEGNAPRESGYEAVMATVSAPEDLSWGQLTLSAFEPGSAEPWFQWQAVAQNERNSDTEVLGSSFTALIPPGFTWKLAVTVHSGNPNFKVRRYPFVP